MINIDILHRAVMDNSPLSEKPRHSGKTTATVYELIGAIQTTKLENIICFVKNLKQLDHLFYNLVGDLSLNGITVEHGTHKHHLLVTYEEQPIRIQFISTADEDYHRYLIAMKEYISINFIDY